jgi:hypothetical protein
VVFAGMYTLAPNILDALKIVIPETALRWHRADDPVPVPKPALQAVQAALEYHHNAIARVLLKGATIFD